MSRDRAFSAIIHNGSIIMVKTEEKNRSYWTLPGGRVEGGETQEEAAIREAKEEANIDIKIIRFLFEQQYSAGTAYCYLAVPVGETNIALGYDPELENAEQVLTKVEWKNINDVRNDLQVSRVLEELSESEVEEFNVRLENEGIL